MTRHLPLGLNEALAQTLARLSPLAAETVELIESVDRVAAEDIYAEVDSPSVDASLKDGYAVLSGDVAEAGPEHPVPLTHAGLAAAGGRHDATVSPGSTVRVLTGARIPGNADAVLSEEYARVDGQTVWALNCAEPGRNILPRASDVAIGKIVARRGQRLSPGQVGLLAAAGHSRVPVIKNPEVAIIATGDEVVAPGKPLPEGKLYASNLTTLSAWCRRYGLKTRMRIVRDEPEEILSVLQTAAGTVDAIVTSGGAWTGDRDMVAHVLARLGWQQVFHRIRIGPGKAVGFGRLEGKAVFILPGGPPSNLMGFLQIALPGLLSLAGHPHPGLPRARVRLSEAITGRYADWTQFVFGRIGEGEGAELPVFHPIRKVSRLQSMAEADAVAAIPEGVTRIAAGDIVSVQLL